MANKQWNKRVTKMTQNVDYYIDSKGMWVFTAAYHEARGYCCGEACKHCPYDYEAVPEPIKTRAQLIRSTLGNNKTDAIHTKD
jgi:hypothetical protein